MKNSNFENLLEENQMLVNEVDAFMADLQAAFLKHNIPLQEQTSLMAYFLRKKQGLLELREQLSTAQTWLKNRSSFKARWKMFWHGFRSVFF